jgi:hypothetical protein
LSSFNLTEFCNCLQLQLLAVYLSEWTIQVLLSFSYYVLELCAYFAKRDFCCFDWRQTPVFIALDNEFGLSLAKDQCIWEY